MIRVRTLAAVAMLAGSCCVFAQNVVPPPGAEVTVVAERPGPRLWRVINGDHTVWILGTQTPVPQNMRWRSAEVERAIAGADEVLGAYSVSLSIADLELPTPEPLKRVLSRKQYARWVAMRDKYIDPHVQTEKMLPTAAALHLQSGAYEHVALTSTEEIWSTIHDLARLHNVPIRSQAFTVQPDTSIKINRREARRSGVLFLMETMDKLDTELTMSGKRANAWADGDLGELRRLAPTDESYAASFARSWPFLSPAEVDHIIAQEDTRLAAVFEGALRRNRSTFAALPVYLLMKRNGALSILSAAGYRVEQPADEAAE
jgi:hypothetical protein